jgi:hypothetical protein
LDRKGPGPIERLSVVARIVLIVCVFAVVGPPIGGAVAWLMMGARSLRSPLPFITGAYGEGVMLAIGTGVVCCVVALVLRTASWLVPVGAALAVDAIAFIVTATLDPPRVDLLTALTRVVVVFVPPSIVAALLCWMISRRLLQHGV